MEYYLESSSFFLCNATSVFIAWHGMAWCSIAAV